MTLGWSMNGLEDAIAGIVSATKAKFELITYMEIGIASGGTFVSMCKLLKTGQWRAVGVDLPFGGELNKTGVEQNFTGQHMSISWIHPNGWQQISPTWNQASIVLSDSRDFLEKMWSEPVHLALIDGNHSKKVCMADFVNLEKFIVPGGTVMLHDFDANHPDRGQNYDVYGACEALGILDKKREGWALPRVLTADHAKGGGNMLVIEKL